MGLRRGEPRQQDAFWQFVRPGPGGCMLWVGGTARGYGQLHVDGRPVRAHRYAYELTYGPIPNGMVICHRCDVRRCVNPDHLFVGTQRDNMRDMIKKGRRERTHKAACRRGHEFTAENTYTHKGVRHCKQCNREAALRYFHRKKMAAA